MRGRVLMIAALVTSGWLIGCNGANARMDLTRVAVRFVMPPEQVPCADVDVGVEARLATDASYDGFVDPHGAIGSTLDVYHVALWGDAFDGDDVTYGVTSLRPGSYTFAYLDREHGDLIQGWLEINRGNDDLLDFLYRWKSSLPQQKRQFAYDFEIRGRVGQNEPDIFESFVRQLDAFDDLEARLDKVIQAEVAARTDWHRQVNDLFHGAEVRVLPGGEPVFHPATRAAFSEDDMATVRVGEAVTKVVLLADYKDARWKLRHVNQLYGDLGRFRAVMREAADRLERRKGLYLLTSHLHPDDGRFVENETWLQSTLGVIERLDEQMVNLRQRGMALAFVAGLIAPDDNVRALDEEERGLIRERAVLEAENHRLDLLLERSDESQVKRVALERNRQGVLAALNTLDRQLEDLGAARGALEWMTASASVIHRQGDTRLLAATFADKRLPIAVRQAVERESLMTVRLESSDNVFIPTRTSVAAADQPRAQRTQLVHLHEEDSGEPQEQPGCDQPDGKDRKLPWFARLICPPCWFGE